MQLEVKAKVIREIYHNDNFYILALSPMKIYDNLEITQYGTFTCKGELSMLTVGQEYDLVIEPISNDKYGTCYKVVDVPSLKVEDLSDDDELEILKTITTNSQADYVHKAYPNFIRLILNGEEDKIDIKNIYNVGETRLKVYKRLINEKFRYYYLMKQTKEYKISMSDCKLLLSKYKTIEECVKKINNTPYFILMEVLGRTFENIDKMILDIQPDLKVSKQRCEALIIGVLRRNEVDGSTRLYANDLFYYIKEEYDAKELLPMLKDVAVESDLIYYDEKTKDLSIMSTYLAECKIADFVKSKIQNSKKLNIDYTKYKNTDNFTMSDSQLNALKVFCESNISILAGYSGAGKTTAVKGLVSLMENNHLTYTLLSPTGKASKVLSESTGRKAYTIHKRCFSGSIDTDVVIVDECGMVSLDVFCMLLSAIQNDNARIVLVGDPAQLSSIGLSKIYNDLIKSNKVPMTMLTEVFRYKSNGSLFVATNIRQGKNFFDDDFVKHNENTNEYTVSDNYKFIQTDEVLETVVNEYKKLLQKGIKKENIMVLSPFNVGLFGTYAINNEIQQMINPILPNDKIQSRTVNKTKIVFKEGDLVINTKNDYEAVKADSYYANKDVEGISESDYETTAIVNGQMGIIREVVDKGLIIQFDEEMVYMNRNKLNHLLLGYAISCHKSQGSTIDYSINIVTNAHKNMLSRGLLYVATTRCRKSHIDIGDESAFQYALSVCDNDLRKTWLLDLMTEEK
jgi:exodeoxyribonuclease V alpha subunit|uniref:ATP dependent DNA helicase n=1 Tax=Phage sp. ctGns7 TaxID=2828003 RepID=A0A8S5S903_9VIRU|nr:MAG TPA: ATP dependent DNA helicase [Phage sp. ctGns7]